MHNDITIFDHHSMPAAAYYLGCSPIAPYSASRRLNKLPALLPSLLMAGLVTLVMAAVLRLVWVGFSVDFTSAWMKAWLSSWPIVFPLVYLFNTPVTRLAARIATPAVVREAECDATALGNLRV